MRRRKGIGLIGCIIALAMCASCAPQNAASPVRVTTSVFPIFCLVTQLTVGVPGVSVACLAPSDGCAHDYQITAEDRRLLADSDLIAINGAGLEPYLGAVLPSLRGHVVEASAGIELIQSRSAHGGAEPNPHVWVSIPLAIKQLNTLSAALCEADPTHAAEYRANQLAAERSMMEQFERMRTALAPYAGARIAAFHPAFDYFAADFGLTVAVSLTDDPDAPPSAREIADAIEILMANPARGLFVEPGETPDSARTVASETGIALFELNPVTVPIETISPQDVYIEAMERNLAVLLEALQ